MAKSKELKVNVKLETKAAERSLKNLEKRINAVNAAVNKQSTAANKLSTAINKSVNTANKLHQANQKAASSAAKITRSYQQSGTAVSVLIKKVKQLASAYLGVMGVRAAMTVSDNVTRAENQLNNLPGGNAERTAATMDKVYAAAMRSRSDYSSMLSDVGKLMTLSGEAFQNNEDNAIRFQEIMAKSYALGNMSAAEQASSMYQLTQALGSGVLQGDELRSVREGAALAYQKIEKFAQGVFNTEESLKDLASRGVITSDIVVAAIMSAEQEINEAFTNTNKTFADLGTAIKSNAVKAFEPVGKALNDALNTGAFSNIADTLGTVFIALSNAILFAFSIIENLVRFVADNWPIIIKLVLTLATVIGSILIPKLIATAWLLIQEIYLWILIKLEAIRAAIVAAVQWMMVHWVLALIIIILAAIVIAIIWVADSFVDACGIIVGVVYAVGAVIYNIIAFIINLVIGMVGVVILTACNIGIAFVNAFYSAKAAFWEWVSECLNGTSLIAKAVSKIAHLFGLDAVSIDTKINAAKSNIRDLYSPEEVLMGFSSIEYKDISDSYNNGYAKGVAGGNWITDKLSGLGDLLNGTGLPNVTDPAYDLTSGYDPSGVNDDIANGIKKLGNIDDNTGSIADSMELNAEDMEYLRKVAEMEWKKEFTTATIQVDMSNYNNINGMDDLDGIATRLADKLYEEMDAVANGVYA